METTTKEPQPRLMALRYPMTTGLDKGGKEEIWQTEAQLTLLTPYQMH